MEEKGNLRLFPYCFDEFVRGVLMLVCVCVGVWVGR